MGLVKLIIYVSDWIVLLPLLIGVAVLKKINFDSKLILGVVLAAIPPQMIHFFFNHSKALNITYNIYPPIEFIVFYFLFSGKIIGIRKQFFLKLTGLFYIFYCSYLIVKNGISNHFISELVLLNNVIYLLWIGLYLYEAFEFEKDELTSVNPFFWYIIGILMYSACASIVYALWQRILNNPNSVLKYLWSVQNVFNITMYVLFAIGLWFNKTRPIKNHQ